ncbi:unnamed protein product [Rhizoctonia solani]|uniref:NADH dehydrogenase [ubiquinone] iron-sulfur protein 5 n=1 Tax=Rhizoctonia solani TaxID=456999 RepID=A0A8H2XQ95_9AGAM|nr:unnamed protein product [Rhizoctonia solani]
MASGFGYTGGRSRCFPFWQEFAKCYANADAPSECRAQSEDYLECLHHTKEIARAKTIKAHFVQTQAHQGKEGRKVADILSEGVIVGVGLINKDK